MLPRSISNTEGHRMFVQPTYNCLSAGVTQNHHAVDLLNPDKQSCTSTSTPSSHHAANFPVRTSLFHGFHRALVLSHTCDHLTTLPGVACR